MAESVEVRNGERVAVGDQVRHALQDYNRIGTVVEIEHGCNPIIWVMYEGREFRSPMCPLDICREDRSGLVGQLTTGDNHA